MSEGVKLSPPWHIFYEEMHALFRDDPDLAMSEFDDDTMTIKLYFTNSEKVDALTQLLPTEKKFGNITVRICVIPANDEDESIADLFLKAFEGNPALKEVCNSSNAFHSDASYVAFAKRVVQFYADDLSSLYGIKSMLYQDIAKDVFGDKDGVFFTTSIEDET